MYLLLQIADIILYTYFSICVLYIILFTISSYFYKQKENNKSAIYNRFLVIVPAYKEDSVIFECLKSILRAKYPQGFINTIVVSDQMSDNTNREICNLDVNLLEVKYENSSKAKALKCAINSLSNNNYDYTIILDADNVVPENYFESINEYIISSNCVALQTHRVAKSTKNSISLLDAIIEEMNNTIFRQGHSALNISSTLIGSGMVFKYSWFIENVNNLNSTGEDKELEELLLRQNHHIYYSKEIIFCDEKTSKKDNISKQRTRWIATQLYLVKLLLPNFKYALRTKNIDYILKFVETLIPPRSLMICSILLASIISALIDMNYAAKWWIMLILIITSLYMAIPLHMKNKKILYAISNIPFFLCMMTKNLFRLKGASQRFIHTEHNK